MRPFWADQVAWFGVVAPLEAVLTELKLTLEALGHRGGEDAGRRDAAWTGSVRVGDSVGKQHCCTLLGLRCARWDSHHILDAGKGTAWYHTMLSNCVYCILLPHCLLLAPMLIQFLPNDRKVVNDAPPGFANKRCIVNVLWRQEPEDVLSDDGETVLVEH